MPRRADNSFERAIDLHGEIVSEFPIDNSMFFSSLDTLEQLGTLLMSKRVVSIARFSGAMHRVFSEISDLNIEPPLSEAQNAFVAERVSTYAAMHDRTGTGSLAPRPTDSSAIPTAEAKVAV